MIPAAVAAGAGRITGLGHEAADNPVEDNTVVEAFANQLLDARDMLWRQIRSHFHNNQAVFEFEVQGVVGIGGGGGLGT